MDSQHSSQQVSPLNKTIKDILENGKGYCWRGRKDVLKALDPATQITYLIKIFDEQNVAERIELNTFTTILNSDEGKLIFSGFQGVEVFEHKTYFIFKKQGMSLKKWKKMQKETENKNNDRNHLLQVSVNIAIQVINIADFLRKQDWNIADQLGSLLIIEDEDSCGYCSVSILPDFRTIGSFSELMKMVYNKYVNALAGRDIFPYPPEILSFVLDYEKQKLIPRKEIDDVWSIVVCLLALVGNSEDALLQLVEDDDSKRKEATKKPQFAYQNELAVVLKKVFHADPKMRWNLSQLKKELKSMNAKDGKKQGDTVGNVIQKQQSEGIEKIRQNQAEKTKEITQEKIKKESKDKFTKGSKTWIKDVENCKLIQLMLKEEDDYQKEFILNSNETEKSTMRRDSKSQSFIQIKGILDSVIKVLQKYQLQQQQQQIPYLKEIKKCYLKALIFPFSVNLGEFFWYTGMQAEQLGHLKFSKELFDERENILKAFMDSDLSKQSTELSNDLVALDPVHIGITLASAESHFRYGNKTQSLKLATKVLQIHPYSIPGLYLKGKVKSSFGLNDQAFECFQKCYELLNEKEGRYSVERQLPWMPRKDQINFELGKIYNGIGDFKVADFYFELSLQDSPHIVLSKFFLNLIDQQIDQPDLSNETLAIKLTLEPFSDEAILLELDKITKTISNKIQLLAQNCQKENNSNPDDVAIQNQLKINQVMFKRCETLKTIVISLTNMSLVNSNPQTKTRQPADQALANSSEELNQYSKLLTSSLEHWIYHANLKYKIISFLSHQKFSQEQKRDLLKELISYIPQTCYFSYQLARIYIKKKSFQKAEQLLQKMLNIDYNQPLVFLELGKLMINSKKNLPLGIEYLEKSRGIFQKESEILYLLGRADYKLGNFEKALQYFIIINDESKQIKQELNIIRLTTAKCLLFLGKIQESLRILEKLTKQGIDQTTILMKNIIFYKGICEHNLNKLSLPYDFAKNANYLMSKKKKILALKIALKFYINNDNEAEYSKIKILLESKENDFLDCASDGDVLALFSKAVLASGQHPFLGMHYIEIGLGATSLFNKNEKDNSPKTKRHFGCSVQEAAIEFELSKENSSKLEDLVVKVKSLIEENQFLEATRELPCSEELSPIQAKQKQKESWCFVDWIVTAKILLIKINICLEHFQEAKLIISSFGDPTGKEYFQEFQYLKNVVEYELGENKNELIKLLRLDTFIPSWFYYGQLQFSLMKLRKNKYHLEQAKLTFEKILKQHNSHLPALKALGEVDFLEEDYSLCRKINQCYLDKIQQQNKELQNFDRNREGLPPRRVPIDSNVLHRSGECFFQEKDFSNAIRMFEDSLLIEPNQPKTLFWLGKSLKETAAKSRAIKYLIKSKELEKSPETIYLLGECQFLSQDYANAKINLLEVVSLIPDHFLASRSLGEIFLQEKDFENAKISFEACRKQKISDEITLIGLSDCALQERDFDKANMLLNECLKYNPNSDKCFIRIITFFRNSGKSLDLEMIKDRFSLFKKDIMALYYIGKTLFNEKKYSSAILYLAEIPNAYKIQGKEVQANFLPILQISQLRCAQIYYVQKNLSQSFKEIRSLKPIKLPEKTEEFDLIDNQTFQFQTLFLQGTLRMLLNEKRIHYYFLQCMKIDPSNELPYFQFAFHLWQKKSKDAWRYFKNGMSLAKANTTDTSEYALLLQGLEAIDKGDFKTGKEFLEKCSLKYPQCPACYYELGRIKLEEERYSEAIELLRKSQDCILVDFNSISLSLEQLQQSYCYQAKALLNQSSRQTTEALQMINKCLDINPRNKAALEMKIQLCYEDGQLSEAIKSAELSILADETNPNTFNSLAVASMKQGNTFSAMQCLRKCQQLDQNFPLVNLKLSIVYESIARPHIALGYVLQHLALNPKAIQGLLRSTRLLAYSGKFQAAQTHLDRLFSAIKDPNRSKSVATSSLDLKEPSKQPSKKTIIEDQNNLNDDVVQISQAYAVEGYLRKQEKRYHDAAIAYEQALKLDDKNESTMYSLSEIYSKLKNCDLEIKLLEQLTQLNPNSKRSQWYWNNLGNAYFYVGKMQQSLESYQKAVDLDGEQPEILENLAAGYIFRQQFKSAIEILERVLFKSRNNVKSYFLYGLISQSQGDFVSAKNYFEYSIKTDDTFLPAYLSLAQIKITLGNPKEAISLTQKCLSTESDILFLKAGVFLIDCYLKAGESQDALALCESIQMKTKSSISSKDLENAKISMNISNARVYHYLLGESEKATNIIKNCLLEQPELPEYLHELGTIIVQQVQKHKATDQRKENLNTALSFFRQASNAQPDNAIYLFSIANVHHLMHDYELEVKSLQKCIKISTNFKDQIFNNLALAYQHLLLTDKVKKSFQQGLQINPKSSRLHFNFANFLVSQNDNISACEEYEECLAIEATHLGALHNLARICVQLKMFQRATDCFGQCLRLHPKSKEHYAGKLSILLKQGYYPQKWSSS